MEINKARPSFKGSVTFTDDEVLIVFAALGQSSPTKRRELLEGYDINLQNKRLNEEAILYLGLRDAIVGQEV